MKIVKSLPIVFCALFLETASLISPLVTHAANLTSSKDTLQSSRLSFYGRVKSPTASGSSHVWIYTVADGNATSISTVGLNPGDSLIIGGTNTYTISTIIDSDEFTITSTLAAGDADDTDVIYLKAKPQHVITFNTASAVNGGYFRVLITAAASGSNDNAPDSTGFDFNTSPVITGVDTTGYTFSTGVATASGDTGCTSPTNYHCFEIHYTGSGNIGTNISLAIGNTSGTANLIAPAPKSSHTAGTADIYTFKIQNFTNGSNPNTAEAVDEVTGKIAVIESVRVTATIDPSLTFIISGANASTSHCGLTTDISTTSNSVPFGILTINTFKTAAQTLTVSTNSVSGYAVTAIENERLSNLAASPSYIPDTTCDTGTCTESSEAAWATATDHPGFGYTVALSSGSPTISPTAPNYKPFASLAASESPSQIMSSSGVANSQAADVCYKISIDATQAAGSYENQITYTATATF
ncbi:MAG TPA: hypothetical protein PLI45_04830 [Candidatus Woesebacteria bacterium]|nr:hypothetical protein [Candidatus Woesebacteria bacterium]